MKTRVVGLAVAGVAVSLAIAYAASDTFSERAAKDQVTFVPSGDAAMAKAFEKARATLDEFLALAKTPPPNTDFFSVKVRISDAANDEYFWVGDFRVEGNNFSGRVDNAPRFVKKVREGERIQFDRRDIVDWMYINTIEPRMYGNFTLCVLLKQESAAERAKVIEQYRLQCDG